MAINCQYYDDQKACHLARRQLVITLYSWLCNLLSLTLSPSLPIVHWYVVGIVVTDIGSGGIMKKTCVGGPRRNRRRSMLSCHHRRRSIVGIDWSSYTDCIKVDAVLVEFYVI